MISEETREQITTREAKRETLKGPRKEKREEKKRRIKKKASVSLTERLIFPFRKDLIALNFGKGREGLD